jgi:nucleoside-diphosphate-sugar epimerase
MSMGLTLVTGGAGFIGSNLVHHLLAEGVPVRVLDNFSTGKRANLADCLDDIDLIEGELADLETVRRAMQGVEAVLHQAALPSVPRSISDPLASNESNVLGTLHVLLAARDEGVRRVVYASSSSIYGDQQPGQAKIESMRPQPISPYGVAKLAAEAYCQVFYHAYGLETVALRYFNVFGPRQDPASQYAAVVPRFIKAMLRGEQPTVYGDGQQTRDFTYVADVVSANMLALEAEGAPGEVFNVARHHPHSVNELVAALNELLGVNVEARHTEPRPGDILHSLADIERATTLLGYRPQVSFAEGLRQTIEWFRADGQPGA